MKIARNRFFLGLLLIMCPTFLCGMDIDARWDELCAAFKGSSFLYQTFTYIVQQEGQRRWCKNTCEDRVMVEDDFFRGYDFYAVYDGYWGETVAEYAKENLHKKVAALLEEGFPVESALENAFLAIDEEVRKIYGKEKGAVGSTASVVIIERNALKAYGAHVGDSRICTFRNGTLVHATKNHRVSELDEQMAALARGGIVMTVHEKPAILGRLEVTRSLGYSGIGNSEKKDAFKDKVISARPDIFTGKLLDGDIIILASDGLWDRVSLQRIALETKDKAKSVQDIGRELINMPELYTLDENGKKIFKSDVSIIVIRISVQYRY